MDDTKGEILDSWHGHSMRRRLQLRINDVTKTIQSLKSPAMYWPKVRGAVMVSGLTAIKAEVKRGLSVAM